MATNYNITQKQYNGVDYDTLYPKNTSQQVLLNDSTLGNKMGLSGVTSVNDILNAFASQDIRVVFNSYVGTGVAGPNNPNSLTFSGNGSLQGFIIGTGPEYGDLTNGGLLWLRGSQNIITLGVSTTNELIFDLANTVWTDSSVSWYTIRHDANNNYFPECQCNKAGTTYYYMAIFTR